jgi:hypothetical protein
MCGQPTGCPVNVQLAVRAASALEKALTEQLAAAAADSDPQHLYSEFSRLFISLLHVSMNVHPETLLSMLQDERIRYTNLHDNLRANMLLDYDPELAAKRRGIDSLAFGSAGEKVAYGAVNLGNRGLISYGSVCIFLRNDEIRSRTSFLQENSFSFVKGEFPTITFDLSTALRAVWDTVDRLAFVKHFAQIASGDIDPKQVADIVLVSTGDKQSDRFIEAQIYPPITIRHFARIVYDPTIPRKYGNDRVLKLAAELSDDLLQEGLHYSGLFATKLQREGIEFQYLGSGRRHEH